ncbi:CYTH domain-containing protein [Methylobacterium organophilum]|uniref:CYTH domain-containing protein n=1 Tax=Methylobacterium organophilum TaxID=410 RepID=UPI001F13FF92|nr:CYTH domain-containing protein [Methylobacterium organophilum]UMY18262.1 CYTH domain-containing protein [Methylobacterium organophilum]
MRFEIERKFLVVGESWKAAATDSRLLRDGLIGRFGTGKVRIRMDPERAWITVKGARMGFSRPEFEYEIPQKDAAAMLDAVCVGPIVEKTRYTVPHDGMLWVVDVFEGPLKDVTIAEIELEREDQIFSCPPWIGEEVTGDVRFRQTTLLELCARGRRSISLDDIFALPKLA